MIRSASKEDIPRLAEILIFSKRTTYRSIFQNDIVSFNEMQVVKLADDYQNNPEALKGIKVYDDGIVKGMIKYRKADIKSWELQELYVDPFFIKAGIGTSLMKKFLQEASHQNVKEVFLWVLEDKKAAIDFYKSFNFVCTGVRVDCQTTGKFNIKYKKRI